MSRYRKIDPRIWNDAKFRQLSNSGKLVFFMLLTHPNMTSLGAMRGTVAGLAEELGWETEAFREAFAEALAKGIAEHDQKACLIALPNFIRYNPPESPNVVKAWVNSLDMLPECSLKNRVIQRARDFAKGMNKGFAEALPEAFAKSMPIQEQEQEQEINTLSGKPDDTGKPDSAKKPNFNSEANEILAYLNTVSGSSFEPVPANINLIVARIKEGATVSSIKAVIDRKNKEWANGDMRKYLRPATLFNATKFAQYSGESTGSGSTDAMTPEEKTAAFMRRVSGAEA